MPISQLPQAYWSKHSSALWINGIHFAFLHARPARARAERGPELRKPPGSWANLNLRSVWSSRRGINRRTKETK